MSAKVRVPKNKILKLHLALLSDNLVSQINRALRANPSSNVQIWETLAINSEPNSGKFFVEVVSAVFRKVKWDKGSLWMWLPRPLVYIGNSAFDYFASPTFDRIRLNTVLGRQVMCLRPFVNYHPKLMQFHDKAPIKVAKQHYISIQGDQAGAGDESDNIVSFYLQDFDRANRHKAEGPICDIFKPQLQVLKAPDPNLRLPFDMDKPKGSLADLPALERWSRSLSTRAQKGRILLDWIHHEKLDEDTLEKFGLS